MITTYKEKKANLVNAYSKFNVKDLNPAYVGLRAAQKQIAELAESIITEMENDPKFKQKEISDEQLTQKDINNFWTSPELLEAIKAGKIHNVTWGTK